MTNPRSDLLAEADTLVNGDTDDPDAAYRVLMHELARQDGER